jgi:hypothetical protein
MGVALKRNRAAGLAPPRKPRRKAFTLTGFLFIRRQSEVKCMCSSALSRNDCHLIQLPIIQNCASVFGVYAEGTFFSLSDFRTVTSLQVEGFPYLGQLLLMKPLSPLPTPEEWSKKKISFEDSPPSLLLNGRVLTWPCRSPCGPANISFFTSGTEVP